MSDSGNQAGLRTGAHLVLYDGVCGLCWPLVRFLLEHDRRGVFMFASLQSGYGRAAAERCGGDPDSLSSLYVLRSDPAAGAQLLCRSRAVLFLAGRLGWPWRIALALRVLPTPLLDRMYDVVARSRYRVFGRYQSCVAPRPEYRDRFVDV